MSISVCLATYNGQNHIIKQLDSILDQLGDGDEVIVVDDCSTDNTVNLILQLKDKRINVFKNLKNRGHVFSFDRAIILADNDFIFLADQDDIWLPGRVSAMINELEWSGSSVVSSNFEWMDDNEEFTVIKFDGVSSDNSKTHLKNILHIYLGRTNYFGCAMALRKDFVKLISPVPSYVESHDLWIALASNLVRSNAHLDNKTLRKRKHSNNTTSTVSTRSLYKKIRTRILFTIGLIVIFIRHARTYRLS